MNEVAAWCSGCGAAFHTGSNKTVVMCFGADASLGLPITFNGVFLSVVSAHRWLGPHWPDSLDFTSVLAARLQQCAASVSQLAGLSQMGVVSWAALRELFDSKVDSLMEMDRWLFVMVENAEALLCDANNRWAKLLLGAD